MSGYSARIRGSAGIPAARLAPWLTGAIVSLVLLASVAKDIDLPGVYMDAVNPDYLVVSILNPGREIEAWTLPGNLIAGRFPVLTSLYHGTGQTWLALPFFALLGTSVVTLRLVHGFFACAILICATMVLRRAGLKEVAIAAVGIALAVDPSFVFAFRTQTYITLAPVAWLLGSFLALARAGADGTPRRWLLVSGGAYGLAFFGYFIYLFYLPAVLFAVLAWPTPSGVAGPHWRRIVPWTIGMCLGASAYPIGYALVALHYGSLGGLLDYVVATQKALGVMQSSLDLGGRVAYAWHMVTSVTHNWWQYSMMFGAQASLPGAQTKTWLLTAVPIGLWLASEARRTAGIHLRVVIASGCSFFLLSLAFGSRLGGHHYAALLVLGYLGLALGTTALVRKRDDPAPSWRCAWVALPMAVLLAFSLQGQTEVRSKLRETGGVGLLSDAIDRFAADARREHRKDFYYLPDWGLWMPFAFLTGGEIGFATLPDVTRAREMLCRGRDVHLALVNADRGRRIADWTRELEWADPVVVPYRQRDGVAVFEIATYRSEPAGSAGERCRPR